MSSSDTSGPAGGSQQTGSQPQSRQQQEEARKDRTLAEFLLMLDDYEPLVRPLSRFRAITVRFNRLVDRFRTKLPTIFYSEWGSNARMFDCMA